MTTHSSILAWRIPWREESGGLQSQGRKESDMTEQLTLFIFKKIKLTTSKLTAEQSLTILRKVHQNPATNSIMFTMSNVQSK